MEMKRKTGYPGLMNMALTPLLIMAMAGILSLPGWFLAGAAGVKLAIIITILALIFTPGIPPAVAMKRSGAVPIPPRALPGLHGILRQLSRKAGLETVPRLYYLPSRQPNAFAFGDRSASAIGFTQGLASLLSTQEMAGILSHEITHIKNNDNWIKSLSLLLGRMTGIFSLAAQALLILSLPLILMKDSELNTLLILAMAAAPLACLILIKALSRAREFEADLGAEELLNHPEALASALLKIHAWQQQAGQKQNISPLLKSHPSVRERIRRLKALRPVPPQYGSAPEKAASAFSSARDQDGNIPPHPLAAPEP
jgi:heat shock protein HtpX